MVNSGLFKLIYQLGHSNKLKMCKLCYERAAVVHMDASRLDHKTSTTKKEEETNNLKNNIQLLCK